MSATELPLELCAMVESHLPNSDIKSLRLVCKDFWGKFHLRLDRVFLSANPLNIHVFRSIADHDIFRHGIVEIVWDDARLTDNVSIDEQRALARDWSYLRDSAWSSGDEFVTDSEFAAEIEANRPDDEPPRWFRKLCHDSISDLKRRSVRGSDRPATQARKRQLKARLPGTECWKYHQRLVQQQRKVLDNDDDAKALKYGLARFPALRRLVITPTAHGFLFGPFYQTPMIRAFPHGFVYPVPIAWPTRLDFDYKATYVQAWDDKQRQLYRGVCIVLRELAKQEHHVVEFLIQPNGHKTGLNSRIFYQPCEEYDFFEALLARPGFRHLELSLFADEEEEEDWGALQNGRLHSALSEAKDLEHLDYRVEIDGAQSLDFDTIPPLRSMLPLDQWPKLQHFGLTRTIVKPNELISILQDLSSTIRSVELSEVHLIDEASNSDISNHDLLHRLRDDLNWRTRHPNDQPRIAFHNWSDEGMTRQKCYDVEVASLVYGNGPNPFDGWTEESGEPYVPTGYARDPLEPDYRAPY
ncbi:hypothetical protein G7054_g6202 [Neopestalotiopsis clavispora]|nr:hypothetical protein G7054_g6202 [Neopestalotiopsis clavispora]